MKRILFIVTAIFVVTTAALAQKSAGPSPTDPVPPVVAQHTFRMQGLELAKGTFDQIDDKVWGNSFLIAGTDGKMEGHLALSIDFVSGTPDAINGNRFTKGTWSMALFSEGKYAGSVYGEFVTGSLHWKMGATGVVSAGEVDAKVRITGGTGSYALVPPGDGTLHMTTDFTQPKTFTAANLTVTF